MLCTVSRRLAMHQSLFCAKSRPQPQNQRQGSFHRARLWALVLSRHNRTLLLAATVAQMSGRSLFTGAQPSSGPKSDTGPRCTLPPQSRPQGVFPPDRTRGFAASAADSASYPASFKTDWQEERDDGCPKSLEEYNDVLLHLARRLR
jgi:hypothetical protein